MSQQTITINGKLYDAHTGLPIGNAPVDPAPKNENFSSARTMHSQAMHRVTQKSNTLNRSIVKKTASMTPKKAQTATQPSQPNKSHTISKFAPHPADAKKRRRVMSDIAPQSHPMVNKANSQILAKKQRPNLGPIAKSPPQPAKGPVKMAPKPSHIIKQEAVQGAIQKAPSHSAALHEQHKPARRKTSRMLSIASASLALILLGGYFTYLNMPNLSVRVAAAQAGIDASYPSYHPDGYSLRGPVAYDDGKVSMKFAANANAGQEFTITQTKTDWDSTAVQENFVRKEWGDDVMQYAEHGLTIYTNESDAVWVNNGILYRIDGNAPLSGSQLRNIATSL